LLTGTATPIKTIGSGTCRSASPRSANASGSDHGKGDDEEGGVRLIEEERQQALDEYRRAVRGLSDAEVAWDLTCNISPELREILLSEKERRSERPRQ
jgi:hypothetical protein